MESCSPVFWIMAVVFIVGLVIMLGQNAGRGKEKAEAEAAYRASLAALKMAPTDADLKEDSLRKGRVYSNLTRNRQGVTMFDEVALMNDINAASAGAGAPRPTREGADKTIEARLSSLQQLKAKNLISEQEYQQRRAEILKEV